MDNKGYNKSKQVEVEYRLADEKLADELQVKSDDWFKTLTRDEKEFLLLRNSKYSIKFLNESWEVTVND